MTDYYKENFEFIKSFYPITKEIYDSLYALAELKKSKAKTKILDLGEVPQKIYIINKGVIRSFVTLDNGREFTKTLFTPIVFFASFPAVLRAEPSETLFETLTEAHYYEIDYKGFAELCNSNFEVMKFYAKFLEFLNVLADETHIDLITLDATARYLKLRGRIPNIDNLIPQYQIAATLGITPVQLSRIRAKL